MAFRAYHNAKSISLHVILMLQSTFVRHDIGWPFHRHMND